MTSAKALLCLRTVRHAAVMLDVLQYATIDLRQ